jgi:ABC-2 type transport system ATP-binding protein
VIEVERLRKLYGSVEALRDVSFAVEPGTVYALLGPNGAGKTTTVKILTTLSRPDGGSARVAGIDVMRAPRRVRQRIGVVAQQAGTDTEATGRENLMLQGRLCGVGGAALRERVGELLDAFGLADAADRAARTYSGGMRRRLEIAMGILHRPTILFLDEPTAGLDPEARRLVWREVERLRGEGLTILLTTHYLDEAERLATTVGIVDRGSLVAEGHPEALKAEIGSDVITVELMDGDAQHALRALTGYDAEIAGEGRVRARVPDAGRAVPAVVATLAEADCAPLSVTVTRPSLDDVFVKHAGRAFDGGAG